MISERTFSGPVTLGLVFAVALVVTEQTRAEEHQVAGFTEIVMQLEGDRDYGEYLAGECLTCHQESGDDEGIPPIVGITRDHFIRALFEYKMNLRSNEVMKLRVANLGNEEIAALAAYFTSLAPK